MSNCGEDCFDAGTKADEAGKIDKWSCNGDSSIRKLWIPNRVTSIGPNAFSGCANLEEVIFEPGDEFPLTIGLMAFARCGSLKKISLPARTVCIDRGCFRDDTALEAIEIGEGTRPLAVGGHLFDNCAGQSLLRKTIADEVARRLKEGYTVEAVRKEEFEKLWSEYQKFFRVYGPSSHEETITLKSGRTEYVFRCRWNIGTVLVGMISPWFGDWDYAQLCCGECDAGYGFNSKVWRKKVVRLLLNEIICRNNWLQENPSMVALRDRTIKKDLEESEAKIEGIPNRIAFLAKWKGGKSEEEISREIESLEKSLLKEKARREQLSKTWYAKYLWTRQKMAEPWGDFGGRYYIRGINRLFSAKIHCRWAIIDQAYEKAAKDAAKARQKSGDRV